MRQGDVRRLLRKDVPLSESSILPYVRPIPQQTFLNPVLLQGVSPLCGDGNSSCSFKLVFFHYQPWKHWGDNGSRGREAAVGPTNLVTD